MTASLQQVAPDTIKTILSEVFSAPEYQWRQRNLLSMVSDYWRRIMAAMEGLQSTHPIAYYVLLVVLVAVLIAILTHFGYILWRVLRPLERATRFAAKRTAPIRDAKWYVRESQRMVAAGRFPEAMVARFRALALILSERRMLQFHPSKTPAEYLREAQLSQEEHVRLGDLVAALYGYLFGGFPCTEGDAFRFDRLASELERGIAAR
ncbi:MAG: DUF4129 domain-containing protein [Gemmatimonadales bacterium]